MPFAQRPRLYRLARQRGQALIYGIFLLLAGSAALFFMFNTGQLTSEKTKLVNTADAVAYSAGIMHARALNFDSYTNRAMMANEVAIAQMVSISSWIQYAERHINAVPPLNCLTWYSVPIALALVKYEPLCLAMAYPPIRLAVNYAKQVINPVAAGVVTASELAKENLQLSQAAMFVAMIPARKKVMEDVAESNYRNDGTIKVDTIPLTDNWSLFDGGPLLKRYTGNERTRFRDAELDAAFADAFVKGRNWDDHSAWKFCVPIRGDANRTGGTTLNGFDSWQANDSANLRVEGLRGFIPKCKTIRTYGLGSGSRTANKSSGSGWRYSGVPSFFELSAAALKYEPNNKDAAKREVLVRFAIRLTRDKDQAKTSEGRSGVKPSGRLDLSHGDEAKNVMAALSTSEVFFDRPVARGDGKKELASTFNPFWQVRLSGNSAAALAAAIAQQ